MKTASSSNREKRRAAGERNEPFVAKRPETEIEFVLIERSALQILTAVSKAVLQFRQNNPEHKDTADTLQVEVAVQLGEDAMRVADATGSTKLQFTK